VLDELASELPTADVLVVDDGSTDGTAEVAHSRRAEVLGFEDNRGLREAIAAGYRYADDHDYPYCGRIDADGQHPVAELRRLLQLVQSGACDVAVGSRFASGDGYAPYRYRSSGARSFGTALLRRALPLRLGREFMDPTSGMYAANAKALPILAEPYRSGAPEVESLLRLADAGLVVEEVPVDMRPRAGGASKLSGKKALVLVGTVFGTLLLYRRLHRR
jgi:glycosyltransferase involved in cell wall biosynthesis